MRALLLLVLVATCWGAPTLDDKTKTLNHIDGLANNLEKEVTGDLSDIDRVLAGHVDDESGEQFREITKKQSPTTKGVNALLHPAASKATESSGKATAQSEADSEPQTHQAGEDDISSVSVSPVFKEVLPSNHNAPADARFREIQRHRSQAQTTHKHRQQHHAQAHHKEQHKQQRKRTHKKQARAVRKHEQKQRKHSTKRRQPPHKPAHRASPAHKMVKKHAPKDTIDDSSVDDRSPEATASETAAAQSALQSGLIKMETQLYSRTVPATGKEANKMESQWVNMLDSAVDKAFHLPATSDEQSSQDQSSAGSDDDSDSSSQAALDLDSNSSSSSDSDDSDDSSDGDDSVDSASASHDDDDDSDDGDDESSASDTQDNDSADSESESDADSDDDDDDAYRFAQVHTTQTAKSKKAAQHTAQKTKRVKTRQHAHAKVKTHKAAAHRTTARQHAQVTAADLLSKALDTNEIERSAVQAMQQSEKEAEEQVSRQAAALTEKSSGLLNAGDSEMPDLDAPVLTHRRAHRPAPQNDDDGIGSALSVIAQETNREEANLNSMSSVDPVLAETSATMRRHRRSGRQARRLRRRRDEDDDELARTDTTRADTKLALMAEERLGTPANDNGDMDATEAAIVDHFGEDSELVMAEADATVQKIAKKNKFSPFTVQGVHDEYHHYHPRLVTDAMLADATNTRAAVHSDPIETAHQLLDDDWSNKNTPSLVSVNERALPQLPSLEPPSERRAREQAEKTNTIVVPA